MKVLFIGGTGNISSACSRLCVERGMEVFLLNRGKTSMDIPGAKSFVADINNKKEVEEVLRGQTFDVVANFIAFKPEDVRRDYELFHDKAGQYIFISSTSAYQKPQSHPVMTESTPLKNPYWDYSRDKIACEEELNRLFREKDFPMTIVRPSLTYQYVIPVAIGSWTDFTIADRMLKGKPVIVHGDGTSLWTITHSEDFAVAFAGLLGHQQAMGQSFHITSDEILNWDQIYQAVGHALGVEPKIVHVASDFICDVADKMDWQWMRGNLHGDKAVSVIFDNTKIKTFVPEYQAVIPFKAGIKRTLDWFREKPERMVIEAANNTFIDRVLEEYQR